MHKTNRFAYANIIQFNTDILFLIITYYLAYFVASKYAALNGIDQYLWILVIFIPLWICIMALHGMYDTTTFYYYDRVLRNVVFASVSASLGMATMLYFIRETNTSRLFIGTFFILCIICMFVERILCDRLFRQFAHRDSVPKIIVVCTNETYQMFHKYLDKTQIAYSIIGIIQLDRDVIVPGQKNLGSLENICNVIKNSVVDEVIFVIPKQYMGKIDKYVNNCEQMGLTTRIVLILNNMRESHVNISMLGPLPVLTFHTVNLNTVQAAIKRSIDILGSLVGIVITIIATLFIAPAIKRDDSGPIFFAQNRVGKYGRVFKIYKFRTMSIDAESQKAHLMAMNELKSDFMFKIENDPRVTKVGAFLRKTSLDELPQFFNVLRGDMSLVGTRPPTLDEVDQYNFDHRRRMSIKPGITGLWQVSGRSSIKDFEQVLALDIHYIDTWSVWLDITILLKTIVAVVRRKWSY